MRCASRRRSAPASISRTARGSSSATSSRRTFCSRMATPCWRTSASRGFRPEVPAAAERAIVHALAKDPAQRYGSVAEFVGALIARDGPDVARMPATTRSIAVLPFVNASPDADNEYLSDGITDELID